MELGGNGGFHGYRRQLPHPHSTASGMGMGMGMMMGHNDAVPDMNMNMNIGLPSQTNHIPIHHHHNNNSSSSSATPENQDHQNDQCIVREQDRFMPIANVIRIMRKMLPPHAKISDDAKETIQECVSEFISFITGEANERCQNEQRKTITAEDVLWAMSKLGFDDYIEPLTLYLHRYREFDGGDRGSLRGDPHSLTIKRPAVHPPAGGYHGPPVFHHLPPRHPGATFYGVMPMNGGLQGYHFKVDPSNGGSTSQAAMTPKSNGSHDHFAPAPKE